MISSQKPGVVIGYLSDTSRGGLGDLEVGLRLLSIRTGEGVHGGVAVVVVGGASVDIAVFVAQLQLIRGLLGDVGVHNLASASGATLLEARVLVEAALAFDGVGKGGVVFGGALHGNVEGPVAAVCATEVEVGHVEGAWEIVVRHCLASWSFALRSGDSEGGGAGGEQSREVHIEKDVEVGGIFDKGSLKDWWLDELVA